MQNDAPTYNEGFQPDDTRMKSDHALSPGRLSNSSTSCMCASLMPSREGQCRLGGWRDRQACKGKIAREVTTKVKKNLF